jgi:hypothetical protein
LRLGWVVEGGRAERALLAGWRARMVIQGGRRSVAKGSRGRKARSAAEGRCCDCGPLAVVATPGVGEAEACWWVEGWRGCLASSR